MKNPRGASHDDGAANSDPPSGSPGDEASRDDGAATSGLPSGSPVEQKSTSNTDHPHAVYSPGGGEATHSGGPSAIDGARGAPCGADEMKASDFSGAAGQPAVADAPFAGAAIGMPALPPAAGSGSASTRRPSSTLAWLLVMQVQFLAILSLVDSVGSGNSWLSKFLEGMR